MCHKYAHCSVAALVIVQVLLLTAAPSGAGPTPNRIRRHLVPADAGMSGAAWTAAAGPNMPPKGTALRARLEEAVDEMIRFANPPRPVSKEVRDLLLEIFLGRYMAGRRIATPGGEGSMALISG